MIALLSLLFPLLSQAQFPQWQGSGSCYLSRASHSPDIKSTCEYKSWITREDSSLSITNCIQWKQEWGEGWECPKNTYEIRNGNELWLTLGGSPALAGTLTENEIRIDYAFRNTKSHERYLFKDGQLNFSWDLVSSGMRWNYFATMRPAETHH